MRSKYNIVPPSEGGGLGGVLDIRVRQDGGKLELKLI